MHIELPDPHPGRCLNVRGGLRCLDYDGHDSACSFPSSVVSSPVDYSWASTQPEPWVSPLRKETNDE